MRVFLTGATGFIGGHLASRLQARGDEIVALVRPSSRTDALEAIGAKLVVGDIGDASTYESMLAGVDLAVHAAAIVDVTRNRRIPMLKTNVDGTRMFLETCRNRGVHRVVHVSSIAALGWDDDGHADEQSQPTMPYSSAYQESKHAADLLATRMAAEGLDVVLVNPSIVIGSKDPKTGRVLRRYLARRWPPVPAFRGTASYVHIDDLVDGILLAAKRGRTGQRYVLTQANWTHRRMLRELEEATGIRVHRAPRWLVLSGAALVELLARGTGQRRPATRRALRYLDQNHSYTSQKAHTELGWQPEPFRQRLRQTLQEIQEEIDADR